jgi:ubiquitin C-terminal hydrolase
VVVPKLFRHTIAKINENFGSDDQQDTQEYIGFLIDGLHEDTNMRNDKPYFEAPESEGKELIELGLETWSKNLSRDWSFIYFMFYGQT